MRVGAGEVGDEGGVFGRIKAVEARVVPGVALVAGAGADQMNGRQIRNMVKTARQLAVYRNEGLEYTHLEHVIDIANEFEEYLKKGHRHDDDMYAREQGTRFD